MQKKMILPAFLALALGSGAVLASEDTKSPSPDWSFRGIFGTFDRAALKRGFQVYSEVCAACHSLNLLSYRNLETIGFTKNEVKAIAAEKEVEDGPNDDGEMFMRPAKPADRFVSPYPNKKAAQAANNGATPPDLSLVVKARVGGEDYIYSLLTGYLDEAPKGFDMLEGSNYNTAFPSKQIAMPPPLSDEAVDYADGTKPTLDQLAKDVTTFLTWAAEPELEARKSMGIKVILFLLVLTGMLYALKKRIWAKLH